MTETRSLVTGFSETPDNRDWEAWSTLLHADVVYEIPQTQGENPGSGSIPPFQSGAPGAWHLRVGVAIDDEEDGVAWFLWEVEGAEPADAMVFFPFFDRLVTSVTDFWPEPYKPPPGREHLVERW